MISRERIRALIERPANQNRVLSVFLDMSVNSDNKRTYGIFLSQEKAAFQELDSDRERHHREPLGQAFARLEEWVEGSYHQASKGLAIYAEVGGDWLEGIQLPVPVANRLVLDERPVVAPLVELVERYHQHGVILVDREHLRLLSLYLDQTLHERQVATDPYPTPHDVKAGGFSAKDYQQRKAEETRHFFREFAAEVEKFDRRHQPDDLILLGTHENVKQFIQFLPDAVARKVTHTDRLEIDATPAAIREKLTPVIKARLEEAETRAVDRLRDRVRHSHLAVAGLDDTLERLQEGKVQTLVIARDLEREGGRCAGCGFVLASASGSCPYCGGEVREQVDLLEAMVRMAEDQNAEIQFVAGSSLGELGGVGGLLRF